MKRLLLVVAAGALVGPPSAFAETPVASAVVYEVNEALTFLKGKRRPTLDPAEFSRRLAHASLLGREVRALTPDSVFAEGQFLQANAVSNVDLKSGQGTLKGSFALLTDLDPKRESLDTLMVTHRGSVDGWLDLTTAGQGFAEMSGQWSLGKRLPRGSFRGLFLIPFQIPGGGEQYYYLDLGLEGPGTLCASQAGICPLETHEFSLGIPLTKTLIVFNQ
jgi:hypothetical protein